MRNLNKKGGVVASTGDGAVWYVNYCVFVKLMYP
jgi:hypothetical protein